MRNSSVSSFTPYLKTKYSQVKIEGSPFPKKLQLNRYPLPKVSHRKMPPLYVSKTQFLSIHQKQKKLSKIFSVANIEQRQLTSKILSFRENEIDAIIENNDSFNDRYSPTKHKFSHKLIGEVQLPRKFFNSSSNDKLFSKTSLTFRTNALKFPESLSKPVRNSNKPSQDVLREYRRKALTSIEHYKRLRIDPTAIPRLKEFLPGIPYGHSKSEDFLIASKEGNVEKVLALLELNKWLAHVFDKSGQTGLHWAIKRKQSQVARVLIQSGIWVDVCDSVKYK